MSDGLMLGGISRIAFIR